MRARLGTRVSRAHSLLTQRRRDAKPQRRKRRNAKTRRVVTDCGLMQFWRISHPGGALPCLRFDVILGANETGFGVCRDFPAAPFCHGVGTAVRVCCSRPRRALRRCRAKLVHHSKRSPARCIHLRSSWSDFVSTSVWVHNFGLVVLPRDGGCFDGCPSDQAED